MAEQMIHQNNGAHCFSYGRAAQPYARVMATLGYNLYRLTFPIDGIAGNTNT
jgi:hypothetical protein